ncbi:MAG: phosphate ABC transporter substrate-binding protein PstS, partial [Psychrobacter sp.]|nr:phosphate ABC transporter substrate-binding protein PstS [Psychrobacter sp.]
MRYSLLAVAVSCTLALTACNKSTDTSEPAADNSSAVTTTETTTQTQATPAAGTGFKSAENIAMNITGAGASFPQPIYAKWSYDY